MVVSRRDLKIAGLFLFSFLLSMSLFRAYLPLPQSPSPGSKPAPPPEVKRGSIGFVRQTYGTVKKNSDWARIDNGLELTEPLYHGDELTVADSAAAVILFHGGNALYLESGSSVRLHRSSDQNQSGQLGVTLFSGRAHLALENTSPHELEERKKEIYFQNQAQEKFRLPAGKHLVVSLDTHKPEGETIAMALSEIPTIEVLKRMAFQKEFYRDRPLIVSPLDELQHTRFDLLHFWGGSLYAPIPIFPPQEARVDLTYRRDLMFRWKPPEKQLLDPIVGYEVIVRPAFGYAVEEKARKSHTLKAYGVEETLIEPIGGSGVFLWAVRAVTSTGKRGPASQARWLEIQFPQLLRAPDLLKPKIE